MTRESRIFEVAWLAVKTGISPNELLRLSADMYRAVCLAVEGKK